jgi:hypothetical protein
MMVLKGWNSTAMYDHVGDLQDALKQSGQPLEWTLPPEN